MELREVTHNEILDVSKLYIELAYFIKEKTNDDYFNFDELPLDSISSQLGFLITDNSKKIFVAIENGRTIGFIFGEIVGCFLPVSKTQRIGYISGAYVLPKFRGRGIMKSLEALMIGFFKDNNINYVELNTMSKNILAKKSWTGLGYSTYREYMRKQI